MIWGTAVSGTQFFGYSIALGGLMYYKLGAEQIKGYLAQGGRSWQELGQTKPALRKFVVFGAVLLVMFLLLGGLAPTYAPQQTDKLRGYLGTVGAGVIST